MVHVAGFECSIYWAVLPSPFLRRIHSGIPPSPDFDKVTIKHTKPQSLVEPSSRSQFIRLFVLLVRFVAGGYANVGHLRRSGNNIHRSESLPEVVKGPPQEVLEEEELEAWENGEELGIYGS